MTTLGSPPPGRGPGVLTLQSGQPFPPIRPNTIVELARGGVWHTPLLLSGPNVTIRAAAGAGPLPRIQVPSGTALIGNGLSGCTIQDIEFTTDHGTAQGLAFHGCTNLTLAGLIVHGFTFGVTIEASAPPGKPVIRSSNINIERCRIFDNWAPYGTHSTGLYADQTDDLSITGSLIDRNGWVNATTPNFAENQGCYITAECGPAVVTGNCFSRNNNYGLQARSGGNVVNNLFLDNGNGLSFGLVNGIGSVYAGGVTGQVASNIFLGAGAVFGNVLSVMVSGNAATDGAPHGPAFSTMPCQLTANNQWVAKKLPGGKPVGIKDLKILGNSVWNWPAGEYHAWDGKPTVQPMWAPKDLRDIRPMFGADIIDRLRSGKDDIAADVRAVLSQVK